jgi:hypothetical protein
MEELRELFEKGNPRRVYISPNLRAFDHLCGLVLAKRNITLIVDEVDTFCDITPRGIPSNFRKVVKYGRHRQVNYIVVCRRPMEMNRLIRTQANRFIIFPMAGEDAKDLSPYIGDKPAKAILALHSHLNEMTQYIDYNFQTRTYKIETIKYSSQKLNT